MGYLRFLIIILLLTACSSVKTVHTNYYQQLDSILKVERVLTYDSIEFQDYETKEYFYEYYFIRDSLVLRWIKRGDSIIITKRIDK